MNLTHEDYIAFKAKRVTGRELAERYGVQLSEIYKVLKDFSPRKNTAFKRELTEALRSAVPHDPEINPTNVAKRYGYPDVSAAVRACGFKSINALRFADAAETFLPFLKEHNLRLIGRSLYRVKPKSKPVDLTAEELAQFKETPLLFWQQYGPAIETRWQPTAKHAKPPGFKRVQAQFKTLETCIALWRRKATYKEIQKATGAHARIVTLAHRIAELYEPGDLTWVQSVFNEADQEKLKLLGLTS